MPFSLWAILATWLNLGAPQNLQEKRTYYKKSEKKIKKLITFTFQL
jgi:hypothetical protein